MLCFGVVKNTEKRELSCCLWCNSNSTLTQTYNIPTINQISGFFKYIEHIKRLFLIISIKTLKLTTKPKT